MLDSDTFDPQEYVKAARARMNGSGGGAGGGGEPTTAPWPAPLDLAELAQHEPDPPEFIVPDWMPAGYATLLAGHGGVGKSYIALYLAACIALGRDWWGRTTARRHVVYLSCEDRQKILHWRLARICAYLQVDMADLAGWLDIVDLVGHETILWQAPAGADAPTTTAAYRTLAQRARGDDVLFVDGISDTFGGNENDRAQVKAFVNELLSLISADQGALVLIGHVNKPSASAANTSQGYSGSTQWHNAVRARMYLHAEVADDPDGGQPETTGNLILDLQKSNLGRAEQAIRFAWDDDAKLFTCIDGDTAGEHWIDRTQRENRAKQVFLALLDRTDREGRPVSHKPRASNFAPKAFAKRTDRDGFRKRDFEQAMEALFQTGEIEVQTYKGTDRNKYDRLVSTAGGACGHV